MTATEQQSHVLPNEVASGAQLLPHKNADKNDNTDENSDDGTTSTKPSLLKLISLAKPEWCMLSVAFILMIAAEATGLINPLLIADAYDYLVDPALNNKQRLSEINRIMLVVVIVHCAGIVGAFLRSAIMGAAGERVVARLRNQVYACILQQEVAFFDAHKSGELVSRLGSDTTLLQQGTSQALPEVVLGITKFTVAIALMFWISPQLASVTLGSVVIIVAICFPFGQWIGALSKSYQDILGLAQTYSTEALGSIRTVQSFAAQDREVTRYKHAIGDPAEYPCWWPVDSKTRKTTYSVGFFKSIVGSAFMICIFGLGFGCMYLSLWYGFKLVLDGSISLGQLTAFQSYVFQIGASVGQTSRFVTQLIEAQGASGRVFYLLERVPRIPTPRSSSNASSCKEGGRDGGDNEDDFEKGKSTLQTVKPETMRGAISFTNVNFAYPSRLAVPVLQNFNLTIPPNTTAALVGASGAGKSTVVALLQRFYDVTDGSIDIDGIDIRSLDLQWLRSKIGYVQQEPQLFGLSIRDNVCYGVDREVSEEELHRICRKANAHDFIMNWPNGYDTLVGERGVKLSGGQKQRIAIARALLVDPRILLLDEATSALDAESEHLVQEAINAAVVGRTVVIVAHRLSTIQRASQIIVMDHHQIIDVGDHETLLQRCSKYKELIKRQAIRNALPSCNGEADGENK